MPRCRPRGLSRNRQPASLSQILEENQNHQFPRANWHHGPAFGPVTVRPVSAALECGSLAAGASAGGPCADHPRGDFLLALPRILLPLSNNPFALNARRAAFHQLAGRTPSCLVPLPTASHGSDILWSYMKPENKMVAAVVGLGVGRVGAAAGGVNSPRWGVKGKEEQHERGVPGLNSPQ